MKAVLGLLVAVMLAPMVSHADVSETSMKLGNVLHNKKFEEDHKITDLELRAEAGSLSRYSMKFDLSFSGPGLDRLYDQNVPNPDNSSKPHRTALSGYMGVRYRIDRNSGLYASTGMKWYSPYQQVTGQHVNTYNEQNFEASNPGLSYDRTYALGATQMRTSVGEDIITQDYYVKRGEVAETTVGQTVKWRPGHQRWILGAEVSTDLFQYNRRYRATDGSVSNYYLNLIPSVEYKLTDNLNFNTSLDYPFQNLRNMRNWVSWSHPLSTWRVGVGWAIKRDIYINPYVNFYAEAPKFQTASLNFNAIFSIF